MILDIDTDKKVITLKEPTKLRDIVGAFGDWKWWDEYTIDFPKKEENL